MLNLRLTTLTLLCCLAASSWLSVAAASDTEPSNDVISEEPPAGLSQRLTTFANTVRQKLRQSWKPGGTDLSAEIQLDPNGSVRTMQFDEAEKNSTAEAEARKTFEGLGPFNAMLGELCAEGITHVRFRATFPGKDTTPAEFWWIQDKSKLYLQNAGVRATQRLSFDTAIRLLKLALDIDPNYKTAKANLAIAYNNKGLVLRHEPQKAKVCFEKAIELDPSNPVSQENLKGINRILSGKPLQEKAAVDSPTKPLTTSTNAEKELATAQPAKDKDAGKTFNAEALQKLWQGCVLVGARRNPFRVRFKLNSSGTFTQDKPDEANPRIFNTSGNISIDNFALDCVKKAAPYDFYNSAQPKTLYDATFDLQQKTVVITVAALRPDARPFMEALQTRIKSNWMPPKGKETKRIVVAFKVLWDGSAIDPKIIESSGPSVDDADRAALAAVKKASPFPFPLPEAAGDSVDVQFTFDYNVFVKKPAPPTP